MGDSNTSVDLFSQSILEDLQDQWNTTLGESELDKMLSEYADKAEKELITTTKAATNTRKNTERKGH